MHKENIDRFFNSLMKNITYLMKISKFVTIVKLKIGHNLMKKNRSITCWN